MTGSEPVRKNCHELGKDYTIPLPQHRRGSKLLFGFDGPVLPFRHSPVSALRKTQSVVPFFAMTIVFAEVGFRHGKNEYRERGAERDYQVFRKQEQYTMSPWWEVSNHGPSSLDDPSRWTKLTELLVLSPLFSSGVLQAQRCIAGRRASYRRWLAVRGGLRSRPLRESRPGRRRSLSPHVGCCLIWLQ
jgi:hypothetical protein